MSFDLRRLRTLGATVLVAGGLLALLPSTTSALALWSFVGSVTDPLGTPIAGATVSDGGQQTTTASNGSYSLGENGSGTYTLTAIATHHAQQAKQATVTVPVNTTVNFALPYVISGALSDQYLSTASGAANSTLTITDWAPVNGSCVTVTDSRTNQAGDATLVSQNSDSSSTWTYALSAPKGSTEGSYQLSIEATSCSSGTAWSTIGTVGYMVDNTPPAIVELLPLDGGNTAFVSQPLVAVATDSGSGISPSSYVFTLTNDTTNTTTSYSGSAVTVRNGAAYTAPLSLMLGDVYKASVSVADNAGNATTFNQANGFDVISETPAASTTASIPSTPCTLSSGGPPGTQTATCPNVPMDLAATSTELTGAMTTPVAGYVDEAVSLSSAEMSTTIGGAPVSAPAYVTSAPTVTAPMFFSVSSPVIGNTSIPVPTAIDNIGTLTAQVPSTWKTASISMANASSSARIATCANPSTASPTSSCEPDPLQLGYEVILNHSVSNPQAEAKAEAAQFNLTLVAVEAYQWSPSYQAFIPPSEMPALLADSNVTSVTPEIPSNQGSLSPATVGTTNLPTVSSPCSGQASFAWYAFDGSSSSGGTNWSGMILSGGGPCPSG